MIRCKNTKPNITLFKVLAMPYYSFFIYLYEQNDAKDTIKMMVIFLSTSEFAMNFQYGIFYSLKCIYWDCIVIEETIITRYDIVQKLHTLLVAKRNYFNSGRKPIWEDRTVFYQIIWLSLNGITAVKIVCLFNKEWIRKLSFNKRLCC